MEFIKPGININFLGKRKTAFFISSALILITIILLTVRGGPRLGVDFSGGILIQIKMEGPQSPSSIKDALRSLQLHDSVIQEFGEKGEFEYLIRVRDTDVELTGLSNAVKKALIDHFGQVVEISEGPFSEFSGTVEEVVPEKGKVKVAVSLFGRPTTVELDYLQLKAH